MEDYFYRKRLKSYVVYGHFRKLYNYLVSNILRFQWLKIKSHKGKELSVCNIYAYRDDFLALFYNQKKDILQSILKVSKIRRKKI